MKELRMLLITPNCFLREGIYTLLRKFMSVSITSLRANKDILIAKARELKPGIILMDVNSRCCNTDFLVKLSEEQLTGTKTIIFGITSSDERILGFVKAGVWGLIHSDSSIEGFIDTIKLVEQNMKAIQPALMNTLFFQIEKHAIINGTVHLNGSIHITRREMEIVRLTVNGLTNKEIGKKLSIATYTVKSHIHHILEKTGLHKRIQIATDISLKELLGSESNRNFP